METWLKFSVHWVCRHFLVIKLIVKDKILGYLSNYHNGFLACEVKSCHSREVSETDPSLPSQDSKSKTILFLVLAEVATSKALKAAVSLFN